MDNAPLGVLAVEAAIFIVQVWALVAALRRPQYAWDASPYRRGTWVIVLIVAFFFSCLGFIASAWYLFGIDPKLKSAAQVRQIGFPGGPPPS